MVVWDKNPPVGNRVNLLYKMYVTLKLDDNGCCKIYSVSDDGNQWIVTDERYVVMP